MLFQTLPGKLAHYFVRVYNLIIVFSVCRVIAELFADTILISPEFMINNLHLLLLSVKFSLSTPACFSGNLSLAPVYVCRSAEFYSYTPGLVISLRSLEIHSQNIQLTESMILTQLKYQKFDFHST